MKLVQIPNIGWVIVPKRNIISDVILHYIILSDDDEFKELYKDSIVKDIDGKPDINKVNELCDSDYKILIFYSGLYHNHNRYKTLITVRRFLEIMNNHLEHFRLMDTDNTKDILEWDIIDWIQYTGAEIIRF
tara:strand:- start:521 stop:916 length:396 start_codon:yes stop_codon:yes gene_type:complete